MSETNETDDKTARGRKMTLNLRRTVESGHVRQSFSHGRSKSVLVEKKKRRAVGAGGTAPIAEEVPVKAPPVAEAPQKKPKTEDSQSRRSGVVLRQLSDEEKDARVRALSDSKVREAEERERAEADAARRAVTEDSRVKEREEADERQVKEQARLATEAEARRKGEDTARKHLTNEVEEAPKRGALDDRHSKKERVAPKRANEQRVRGRLTITNALDEEQRQRSLASLKRRQERQKKQIAGPQAQVKIQREVVIPEIITIQELANRMAERGVDVIKTLMRDGSMHKITDVIDSDTAQLIAEEFGHVVRRVSEADVEEGFIGEEDNAEDLVSRAPVVTIMGHVDHGKTSLLDAIRTTDVVAHEAGGITQHIGAYQVEIDGHKITFIDTPGHEAFTAMRQRGAQVTDIVILVVAADDGVKPQTVEAINHAKAAQVPMIVAINKIDKPGADPKRVRTELLSHEIVVESLGGDTLELEVSALKRTGLDKLLEAILLQAEVLELKANPKRAAEGVIVEAKLERGRGPVGTALIQRGTLHVGDLIVAGSAYGRVRALINDHGEQVKEAGPSVPVEVLGFDSAPEAGDQFAVVENEARARELTDYRMRERRKRIAVAGARGSLEQMMSQLKESGAQEFTLLVKGDVQGSVEAIVSALEKLGTDEVRARVVHAGVGGITESDVGLAATSGAVILGFNVRANTQAREAAERDGVEIRYFNVIYDLVDIVKQAMSGMLAPTRIENFLGNAEILEVFAISKVGKVAGCRVTEGKVERGAHVRLIRDNVVIHEGKLSTLKRFKDEVREVVAGQECGMAFEGYQDMRQGDVIECFDVEHVQRSL
jgi:translation initiation factor IF-2